MINVEKRLRPDLWPALNLQLEFVSLFVIIFCHNAETCQNSRNMLNAYVGLLKAKWSSLKALNLNFFPLSVQLFNLNSVIRWNEYILLIILSNDELASLISQKPLGALKSKVLPSGWSNFERWRRSKLPFRLRKTLQMICDRINILFAKRLYADFGIVCQLMFLQIEGLLSKGSTCNKI